MPFCSSSRDQVVLLLFIGLTLLQSIDAEPKCVAQEKKTSLSERARLALQIQQAVEEIQAVRANRQREAEQHQEKSSQLERQLKRLRDETEPLQIVVENERQEIEQLEKKVAQDQQAIKAARELIGQAVTLARPIAKRSLERAEKRVGDRRRISSFSDAAQRLADEKIDVQLEGLQVFLSVFGEEWLPARSVSLSNERVLLDGGDRSEHAWVVGLGLLSQVFVSEDGKTVGISSSHPKSPWKQNLSSDARSQIRYLVEVVRERKPPSLTPVPVLIKPSSKRGSE